MNNDFFNKVIKSTQQFFEGSIISIKNNMLSVKLDNGSTVNAENIDVVDAKKCVVFLDKSTGKYYAWTGNIHKNTQVVSSRNIERIRHTPLNSISKKITLALSYKVPNNNPRVLPEHISGVTEWSRSSSFSFQIEGYPIGYWDIGSQSNPNPGNINPIPVEIRHCCYFLPTLTSFGYYRGGRNGLWWDYDETSFETNFIPTFDKGYRVNYIPKIPYLYNNDLPDTPENRMVNQIYTDDLNQNPLYFHQLFQVTRGIYAFKPYGESIPSETSQLFTSLTGKSLNDYLIISTNLEDEAIVLNGYNIPIYLSFPAFWWRAYFCRGGIFLSRYYTVGTNNNTASAVQALPQGWIPFGREVSWYTLYDRSIFRPYIPTGGSVTVYRNYRLNPTNLTCKRQFVGINYLGQSNVLTSIFDKGWLAHPTRRYFVLGTDWTNRYNGNPLYESQISPQYAPFSEILINRCPYQLLIASQGSKKIFVLKTGQIKNSFDDVQKVFQTVDELANHRGALSTNSFNFYPPEQHLSYLESLLNTHSSSFKNCANKIEYYSERGRLISAVSFSDRESPLKFRKDFRSIITNTYLYNPFLHLCLGWELTTVDSFTVTLTGYPFPFTITISPELNFGIPPTNFNFNIFNLYLNSCNNSSDFEWVIDELIQENSRYINWFSSNIFFSNALDFSFSNYSRGSLLQNIQSVDRNSLVDNSFILGFASSAFINNFKRNQAVSLKSRDSSNDPYPPPRFWIPFDINNTRDSNISQTQTVLAISIDNYPEWNIPEEEYVYISIYEIEYIGDAPSIGHIRFSSYQGEEDSIYFSSGEAIIEYPSGIPFPSFEYNERYTKDELCSVPVIKSTLRGLTRQYDDFMRNVKKVKQIWRKKRVHVPERKPMSISYTPEHNRVHCTLEDLGQVYGEEPYLYLYRDRVYYKLQDLNYPNQERFYPRIIIEDVDYS